MASERERHVQQLRDIAQLLAHGQADKRSQKVLSQSVDAAADFLEAEQEALDRFIGVISGD